MNLENLGVQEMNAQEVKNVDGGNPIANKLLEWLIGGLSYDAAKKAYNTALNGYIEACGNGTYDGIPGYRR